MFKVTFMIDDKKLGKAMLSLANLAVEPPQIQPMLNAIVKGGRVAAQRAGGMKELIRQHALNAKLKQITGNDLRMLITKAGYSEHSVPSLTTELLKAKALKRIDRGVYECKFN